MSEIKIGELVGLERSNSWGTRVRVVIKVGENNISVADHNGVYEVKPTSLNISLPGFLEIPLSLAMQREYGLDKVV